MVRFGHYHIKVKMRFKKVTFCLVLTLASCQAKSQIFPDTFRGLEVIPYLTPKSDSENLAIKKLLEKEYSLEAVLDRRARGVDFRKSIHLISNPSMISVKASDQAIQLDKAYQKKDYILNLDARVPVTIGGKRWSRKSGVHSFQLFPEFKVRIFNDDPAFNDTSLPVRTPSYMGGLNYFFAPSCFWKRDAETDFLKFKYVSLQGYHHSNGQDGDEFNTDGSINVYNGNFGEQIVLVGMIGGVKETTINRDFKISSSHQPKARTQSIHDHSISNLIYYWKMSFEFHEKEALTSKAFLQYNLYGRNRIKGEFGWLLTPLYRDLIKSGNKYIAVTKTEQKEKFRLILNFSYITDVQYSIGDMNSQERMSYGRFDKRLNLYATLHYRMPGAPHAGLFLQAGYWGSDDYNIYFQQSLVHIRGGISIGFFKYPTKGDL